MRPILLLAVLFVVAACRSGSSTSNEESIRSGDISSTWILSQQASDGTKTLVACPNLSTKSRLQVAVSTLHPLNADRISGAVIRSGCQLLLAKSGNNAGAHFMNQTDIASFNSSCNDDCKGRNVKNCNNIVDMSFAATETIVTDIGGSEQIIRDCYVDFYRRTR